jgi:hypothetical protein
MKDKLLFGTIGLLVGIVVMQWTMPGSIASVVTSPVGNVVASSGASLLMVDGSVWTYSPEQSWRLVIQIPMSVQEVQFFSAANYLVDKNGDAWTIGGNGDVWINIGAPSIEPVATSSSTFGKVKALYTPKGTKP